MTRRSVFSASLLAAGALAGCSPLVDRSNSPDAPPPPADETAPSILSANPSNGARGHSVIQPVTVYFDEPIDPATVTSASVTLERLERVFGPLTDFPSPFSIYDPPTGPVGAPRSSVRGAVAYDEDTRRVTFTPAIPLPYAANLVLTLADVKDLAGNALSTSIAFRTDINSITRYVELGDNPTNAISSVTVNRLDAAGLPAARVTYVPGPDFQWLTADDRIDDRFDVVFGPDGRFDHEVAISPGPDTVYDTADDRPNNWIPVAYDAQGRAIERVLTNQPGTDMTFGTADDVPLFLVTTNYMGTRLIGTNLYTSPGPDAIWRTADDKCDPGGGFFLAPGIWTYTYDASGRKATDAHANCGPDGIPRNGDDVRDISIDYGYDAQGEVIRIDARSDPGADSTWNTADDARFLIHKIERDTNGNPIRAITYTSPGLDGIWDTADDDPGSLSSFGYPLVEAQFELQRRMTYDPATRLLTEATVYDGQGLDGVWGTDDDTIARYTVYTYDARGKRMDRKTYLAGDDLMWHTADDRLVLDLDFDLQR